MFHTKTHRGQMQDIVADYRRQGQPWPATSKEIAAWAVRNKLWIAPRRSQVGECAREIAEAMREEVFADAQGRRVRKKHAIRSVKIMPDGTHKQLTLWVDIETADPVEMRTAFQQRRMQVLGDCRQLKTDVDHYNDSNKHGAEIQMVFDFTEDLDELEQPQEYRATG